MNCERFVTWVFRLLRGAHGVEWGLPRCPQVTLLALLVLALLPVPGCAAMQRGVQSALRGFTRTADEGAGLSEVIHGQFGPSEESMPVPSTAPGLSLLPQADAASVVVKFQHVDFVRLTEAPVLRKRFEQAVRDALRSELGADSGVDGVRVSLQLFPAVAGRRGNADGVRPETVVLAQIFPAVPTINAAAQAASSTTAELQSRLCSDGLVAEALALAVASLSGIGQASTGAVGAGNAVSGGPLLCSPQPVVTLVQPSLSRHGHVEVSRSGHQPEARAYIGQRQWESSLLHVMTGESPWGEASFSQSDSGGRPHEDRSPEDLQGGTQQLVLQQANASLSFARRYKEPSKTLSSMSIPKAVVLAVPAPAPAQVCDPECILGHGICVNGVCYCKDTYSGVACERQSVTGLYIRYWIVLVIAAFAAFLGLFIAYRQSQSKWDERKQQEEKDLNPESFKRVHAETWRADSIDQS